MRTIIYNDGNEIEVSVVIRSEGEDETYKYLNKLCNWLHDSSDVNKDRGYDLTSAEINRVTSQITSALSARGFYDYYK